MLSLEFVCCHDALCVCLTFLHVLCVILPLLWFTFRSLGKTLVCAQCYSQTTMGKSYEGGRKRSTLLVTTRDKNIWLDVKASNTIADIKKMIEQQEGIRQSQQRLIYKGQVLADLRTLSIFQGVRARPRAER